MCYSRTNTFQPVCSMGMCVIRRSPDLDRVTIHSNVYSYLVQYLLSSRSALSSMKESLPVSLCRHCVVKAVSLAILTTATHTDMQWMHFISEPSVFTELIK